MTLTSRPVAMLLVGMVLGGAVIAMGLRLGTSPAPTSGPDSAGQVWTCSMHPQIRLNGPGRCPICGMELIPVQTAGPRASAAEQQPVEHMSLSARARAMARIETAELGERELFKEIRTVGRIELDETRVEHIAARVAGRVDEVFASFPGTPVKPNDHLVRIYSPDLLATQEEFLLNLRREREAKTSGLPAGFSLTASSRRRLELWGITAEQVDELARTSKAETHMVVYAPIGGTVIEKNIRAGQYVKEGDSLFTIADLRHVWLIVEIYEPELSWVRFGQAVEVTLESDPAARFTGTVGFIEPVLNEATRTVRVRVILKNESGQFKPGMFAQSLIQVAIMRDGTPAPTGLEGKYACPMHPYVVAELGGKCTVCQMALERVPGKAAGDSARTPPRTLAVPAEAVLTTGRRQLAYVETKPGEYLLREPKLGPRAGDYYPVLSGLKAGERVVLRGNFLLDSQYQVTGKPSLLYSEGISGDAIGHAGHAPVAVKPDSPGGSAAANLARLDAPDRQAATAQARCPISGEPLGSMGVPIKLKLNDRFVFLCCTGCEPKAKEDPAAVLKKLNESKKSPDSKTHRH